MQVNRTTKYDIRIIKIHLNKIKKVEYKMSLFYRSTRDDNVRVTASQAILKGLAPDGGLFVPESIPSLDKSLEELSKMSYKEVAYEVMKLMLDDFTEEELKNCIDKAYDSKFDTEEIAPLVKAEGAYYLELFHGATIAFKDMALSILPHLLTTSAKKNDVKNEIVILTATSGDTGKAALAGFADVPGTKIIVFYPKGGVSRVQELQMVTQKGENTSVVAIHGNFDHAQSGVKALFEDKELEKELDEASSTNKNDKKKIKDLKAQIKDLSKYKEDEAAFEKEKEKYYEEVVFSDQAPDIQQYKTYYESIDPENAEVLYKQVVEQITYDSQVEDYAKTYSNMKPQEAASIFDTMTDNLGLVADILMNMGTQQRADILGKMDATTAAKLTEIMEPSKKK